MGPTLECAVKIQDWNKYFITLSRPQPPGRRFQYSQPAHSFADQGLNALRGGMGVLPAQGMFDDYPQEDKIIYFPIFEPTLPDLMVWMGQHILDNVILSVAQYHIYYK